MLTNKEVKQEWTNRTKNPKYSMALKRQENKNLTMKLPLHYLKWILFLSSSAWDRDD